MTKDDAFAFSDIAPTATDAFDLPVEPLPPAAPLLRRKLVLAAIGVLLLLGLIAMGGMVLVRRLVTPRAPLPTPTVTATPRPPTPAPTLSQATPESVLAATLVVVTGPGSYQSNYPYLVEYRVQLARGVAATATAACTGCAWSPAGAPVLTLASGQETAFRALVLPPETAQFRLIVDGGECLVWELPAGAQVTPFNGTCAPEN